MRLTDLNPRFVVAGGRGIYEPTGRPCPKCRAGAPRASCRKCFGRGQELRQAPKRTGVGLGFDCPCPTCTAQRVGEHDKDFHLRVFVNFANPIDGGPPMKDERHVWQRTGDTFDTLQLSPSILLKTRCGWHGYVGQQIPGEVTTC